MTDTDGGTIEAEWKLNVLNGPGVYISQDKSEIKAIWYNDIMVPLTQQETSLFHDRVIVNLILAICVIVFVLLAIILKEPNYFFGTGAFYLFQVCESFCSTTLKYISNIEPLKDTVKMINNLRRTRPKMYFFI